MEYYTIRVPLGFSYTLQKMTELTADTPPTNEIWLQEFTQLGAARYRQEEESW